MRGAHDIVADHAYVVLPADYTYKEKEEAVHEAGSTITITLTKRAEGWRMTAWPWAKR